MNGHPSFDITATSSTLLSGKTIVLCLSGSVAVVRAPELARRLMRAGADVRVVMSKAACDLISPDLMQWACGHKPICELTGAIEHVDLVGNVPERADLILVAPATANTIGKIACGIDDGPVTTMVTTGFGEGVPLVIVPAMHLSMYAHPIVRDNIDRLKSYGVHFLMPRIEEGKAKLADEASIVDLVGSILCPVLPLAGKHIVITAGRTVEYLDPIRVITNNSSGKMGAALARAALKLGAEVTLIYGKGTAPAPSGVTLVSVETADQMAAAVKAVLKGSKACDVFLAAAAVGDWKPVKMSQEKIPTSSGRLTIELEPTPKILDGVRDLAPGALICAFRAQAGFSDEQLLADGKERLQKARADLIAVNDTSREGQGFETDTNAYLIIDSNGTSTNLSLASKDQLATSILEICTKKMYNSR